MFENLEEGIQAYLNDQEANEEARFAPCLCALAVRENFGAGGLKALAQASHKKVSTLEAEASIARVLDLRSNRPTLTFVHLNILRLIKDPEEREFWADRASDENWSPAQLRRELAAKKREGKKTEPELVLRKIGSSTERLKGLVDEADEAGVLDEALLTVVGAAEYAKSKANGR